MLRVTNAVLAEKIDNLHLSVNEIKPEIKKNSEYRLKSQGRDNAIKLAIGSGWAVTILMFLLALGGIIG